MTQDRKSAKDRLLEVLDENQHDDFMPRTVRAVIDERRLGALAAQAAAELMTENGRPNGADLIRSLAATIRKERADE